MFKCYTIIAVFGINIMLMINSCTIAYRIPNINTQSVKTHLYSEENRRTDSTLWDSTKYNAKNKNTTSLSVEEDESTKLVYNKYPRFCIGKYRIFHIDIQKNRDFQNSELRGKYISYVDLLTKCNIEVEKYGKYSISYAKDVKDKETREEKANGEEKNIHINSLDIAFSDTSLSLIKGILDEHDPNEDKEFIKFIKTQPIGTYEVKDLISQIPIMNYSRKDLMKVLEEKILNEVTRASLSNVEPIEWEYYPSSKTCRIGMLLKDINEKLYISFKIHPGTKSLVIDNATIKIDVAQKNKENKNENEKECQMDINYEMDDGTAVEIRKNNRKGRRTYVNVAYIKVRHIDDNSMKKIVKRDPLNQKTKLISIYGTNRGKFNKMFDLMLAMANNLPCNQEDEGAVEPRKVDVILDAVSPVEFKNISVHVNSNFKFLIPLLTYVDFSDGGTYLCNRSIPIGEKPYKVWPLWNGTYAEYNMRFVPDCYKNAGFFSNVHMEFDQEDILKILASHREFKNLIVESRRDGQVKSNSEFTGTKVTFEKEKVPQGKEKLRGGETADDNVSCTDGTKDSEEKAKGSEFDLYYINGKNKMIYKSCESAILINLII